MAINTILTRKLNIIYPIIQAPLAGGGDTPELVAAVSKAGALGFIGAAYLTPSQIIEASKAVRARTTRPFGINLFAPMPAPENVENSDEVIEKLAPFYAELSLPEPVYMASAGLPFKDQLSAALQGGASVLSFTFGILSPEDIKAIKSRGLFLMGTATTVNEAVALENAGVDAIIAQGSEAGGHRGTFLGAFESGMIGTIALVPQIADSVKTPVIASGGIMDGRGIAAALTLGASAVQMGTAFLTCHEAGIPEVYKQAILKAGENQTQITKAFTGRPARGIINRFMTEISKAIPDSKIPPFPVQHQLTRPLRSAAARAGKAEFLSLWAGQALRLARRQSAADLITRLVRETDEAILKLKGSK